MGEKKFSKEWYGNKGYRDGQGGERHQHHHDGFLDRVGFRSSSSKEKADSYDKGWKAGNKERKK